MSLHKRVHHMCHCTKECTTCVTAFFYIVSLLLLLLLCVSGGMGHFKYLGSITQGNGGQDRETSLDRG